ncbi:MAG: hypothetical protein ACRESW_04265, partial [Nevskiales bacterium]
MGKREQPDLNESIYRLYEHAALQGPVQFRASAAEVCAGVLQTDGVFWGILHTATPVPASLWRQRVRSSFLADLEPPDWRDFEQALFEDEAITNGAAVTAISPG